jgi:dienelactone hydrolase
LRFSLLLLALLASACTTVSPQRDQRMLSSPATHVPARPAPPSELTVTPHETKTVEGSFILKVYDWLRGDDYEAFRVDYRGVDEEPARAHLLIPPRPGPHPGVMVFPIRGGSHLVSEALAKSLTNRGYVTLRLERRRVFQHGDPTGDFQVPASRLRDSLSDARRLLDWFAARPEVDGDRIGVAGVSLGGIMAATLLGMDERIRAGFFIMAGGGLPEIIHDSHDPRLESFRDGVQGTAGEVDRESFLEAMRPTTVDLDPLTFAANVEPERALIVSARFDRVVPPERTEALWEAMGRPRWIKVPSNHYAILPFFWWSVGQGADLFDQVFAEPSQQQHAAERP